MATERINQALVGKIADAIRDYSYRPGEWLRHVDVEERFGATRTDVRSALSELAVRKTLEHIPNRGYRVPVVDKTMYKAIAETRLLLEVGAAPGIVAKASDADIDRLTEIANEFSAAVATGTTAEQSRINSMFHHFLYGLSGNSVLEETIWSLRDRSRSPHGTVWRSHESLLQSDRDHFDMVAAIKGRDAERLGKVISDHILKSLA